MDKQTNQIIGFECLGKEDVALVGGKNANLGELYKMQNILNILVPAGFSLTTNLYRDFIENNQLADMIKSNLQSYHKGESELVTTGYNIRQAILRGHFTPQQKEEIVDAYQRLCKTVNTPNCDVAVRSSATVEDLPEASFAGQQDSFLNVRGNQVLLDTCLACFASLYTDRAIAYRQQLNISSSGIAIAIGVQKMVHSNKACAGVIFTLDTETGFPHAVLINASWGLGDSVVNSSVVPDRYSVFKPLLSNKINIPVIEKECGSKLVKSIYLDSEEPLNSKYIKNIPTSEKERNQFVLNDEEIIQLANWATAIERVFGYPMDIEWAKDGVTDNLYIVQARPETIESRKDTTFLKSYQLKQHSKVLAEGQSIGRAIVAGKAFYLASPNEIDKFPLGAILVTEMTDPDWVPVMKKAAGIVTDLGGSASHAAIVSRELQVPAIVGTGDATKVIKTSELITLDCASESNAKVYSGNLEFETHIIDLNKIPITKTQVMLNIAIPEGALRWWQLPSSGIGLTQIEFIIANKMKVHPMALLYPERVKNEQIRSTIRNLIRGYENEVEFFVETLSTNLAKIAASCYPKPVIVRCSDFYSKKYRDLLGSEYFEQKNEGNKQDLSRYQEPQYRKAFMLECRALKKVREVVGFDNVIVMLTYCRSLNELDDVMSLMGECDLNKEQHGLEIYMVCEPDADIALVSQIAENFNGLCIDLGGYAKVINKKSSREFNLKVKEKISALITEAHSHNTKIGLSMQTLKDSREFEEYLVNSGIDSISLNPESVANALVEIAALEAKIIAQNEPAK